MFRFHLFSAEPPFRSLAQEWIDHQTLRTSWRREVVRLLGRELSALPRRPDRRALAAVLNDIPHASVRNHCLNIVSAVYRWGIRTGRCETNPAFGLARATIPPRSRVLSMDELQTVWQATDDGSDYFRIVRLLILTGCRKTEIGSLAWHELNRDENRIELPAERMKNHRPFWVPLAPPALELLPKASPGYPFVFGQTRARGFGGWSKARRGLDRLGLAAWTVHDLRRSCSTHWAELGLGDADLIELCLGHARHGIRGVYNRSQRWPERERLAREWAAVVIGSQPNARA